MSEILWRTLWGHLLGTLLAVTMYLTAWGIDRLVAALATPGSASTVFLSDALGWTGAVLAVVTWVVASVYQLIEAARALHARALA